MDAYFSCGFDSFADEREDKDPCEQETETEMPAHVSQVLDALVTLKVEHRVPENTHQTLNNRSNTAYLKIHT